jgi:O-antigen ligase
VTATTYNNHTTPRVAEPSPARRVAEQIPLAVVAVLLLSTAADILPNDSLISVWQIDLNLARLLIILGFAALLWTEGRRLEPFRAGTALPLLLLLVAGLVSSHRWGTYPRYRFLVEGVATFYLTFAVIRTRYESRDALAGVGLVALAVASLVAVAQVSQGELTGFYRHGCVPVTSSGAPPRGSITRAVGTFTNPNILAGYLMLMLPIGGLAATVGRRARVAWPALAITVGFGYLAVIFTYSRAAVLLSIALLGLGVGLSMATRRRYLILVGLAAAVAVSFLFSTCGSDATAGFGRGQEWRMTLEVIRDNPIYGVGLGRIGTVLHHRNALSTARHAHNLFLNWWAEAGTGALIAWLWLAILLIRRAYKGARAGDRAAVWGLMAMVGFFGYSLVDHPANIDRVALAFWIVAGIVAATTVPARPPPLAEPPLAEPYHDDHPPTLVPPPAHAGVVRRRSSPSELDFD